MEELLKKIEKALIDPLLYFMMGLALVYFLWGVVEYLMHADEPEARSTGARHMIWGVIGLAIMVGVFGIMNIIINTIGAN
jgi:hypothetical protein